MRPRGMPSRWVKVCPWYYTERNGPGRWLDNRRAIEWELTMSCDEASHAECSASEHKDWCYEDGSQCIDKDCDCHRRWAETAPEPPW